MTSLFGAEVPLRRAALPPEPSSPPAPPAADGGSPAETEPEYEIVVGRRQIASVSLLVIVAVAVFSGVSYLIGRSVGPHPAAPAPAVVALPAPVPVATPVPAPAPAPVPDVKPAAASSGPLFADPVQGAVYIQVGAVEKGVASIWAEGLRTHGLASFVAPGPNDHIFRVLVGPLPTPEAYTQVKEVLDSIGLATFGKRYQE